MTLIGATTENPYFEVNGALISRSIIFELRPLEKEDINTMMHRAVYDTGKGHGSLSCKVDEDALEFPGGCIGRGCPYRTKCDGTGNPYHRPGARRANPYTLDVASECIQKRVVKL